MASSSPRSSKTASPRRRASLHAKHTTLYPITTALGIKGAVVLKRRVVGKMWGDELRRHSPYPPISSHLPTNYRGHDLSGPLLNTIKEPGGYRQVVRNCFFCGLSSHSYGARSVVGVHRHLVHFLAPIRRLHVVPENPGLPSSKSCRAFLSKPCRRASLVS